MPRLIAISVVLAVIGMAHAVMAEVKTDPTGAWQWKLLNESAVHTLKLKLEGDKLTGSIQSYKNDRESPIEGAAYKDGIVTFKHTYKRRDGQQIVASYSGTVAGDRIKGTIEFRHPERKQTIDWDADQIK